MISELYIKNLAVIEEAVIPFSSSFNVFTGETGAGKSILVNGINAILGQRTSKDIVRAGCDKAIITAMFENIPNSVKVKLDELGIAYDDDKLIITREILSDGGSVARVNMRVATANALKEIGEMLVNIHGQHDNQILLLADNHLAVLDSFGNLDSQKAEYNKHFRMLQDISKKLKKAISDYTNGNDRAEYIQAVVEEINSLSLKEDEDSKLEAEYNIAQNSEHIKRALFRSSILMNGSEEEDSGACESLRMSLKSAEGVSEDMPEIKALCERLESVIAESTDIAYELERIIDKIDIDENRLAYITDRLNAINSIKKKYGESITDVLAVRDKYASELNTFSSSTEQIEELTKERDTILAQTSKLARELSKAREGAADMFVNQVEGELTFLDMPNVKLAVNIQTGKMTATGLDTVEILIATNKGEGLKPLSKIASGGELSRIMLALKSVIAENDDIDTLIFDEIDTGVSGRAAQKIGIKLQELSSHRQVLCVTHLAQLASKADNHLLIEKSVRDERTYTEVKKLDFEGRKYEIARIMCGNDITETALKNAEEQLIGKEQ